MARFGDGFFNGLTECSVSSGVVEHVQIRRRGEKVLVGEALFVFFFDDDPFGVTGKGVELELEEAAGAHGSNRSRKNGGKSREMKEASRN